MYSATISSLCKYYFAKKNSLLMLKRKLGAFMWLQAGGDGEEGSLLGHIIVDRAWKGNKIPSWLTVSSAIITFFVA